MIRVFSIVFLCIAVLTVSAQRPEPIARSASEKQQDRCASTKFFIKLSSPGFVSLGSKTFGIDEIDDILDDISVTGIKPLIESKSLLKTSSVSASGAERIFLVYCKPESGLKDFVKRFKGLASVEYAAPYWIHEWAYTPDDPAYSQQWALTQMKLDQAWDITKGDSSIVIGIVDTGIDTDHPDLTPNMYINSGEYGTNGELSNNGIDDDGNGYTDDWRGWDFIGDGTVDSPNPDNNPEDADEQHGTRTAGCASAATDNGVGIASPGFHTKILPIKITADENGAVDAGYEGLVYALTMGCRVISCSWSVDLVLDPTLRDIVDYAFDQGTLIVLSAGNTGFRLEEYYASYAMPRMVYVGATSESAGRASFSCYGALVDVYAPGEDVLTTTYGGGYDETSGTSFSAPYVAGVAALIFAVHPEWTPDQVAEQLRVTSSTFSSGRSVLGYGIVDAYAAVTQNVTLSDIPGVRLKSMTISNNGKDYISTPGETVTVTAVFENLLAPTSENASIAISFSDAALSSSVSILQLGALGTMDSVALSFDVTVSANYAYSEGDFYSIFTITDGEYTDYQIGFMRLYSTEGWHQVYSPVYNSAFVSLKAVNKNVVWALAQIGMYDFIIYRTTDGGTVWEEVAGTGWPTGYHVSTLQAIDENNAMIGTWGETGYSASVYRTSDGGATWVRATVSAITEYVNGIYMFDAQNAIFAGDPLSSTWGIAKTSDGGGSWSVISNPPSGSGEYGANDCLEFYGDYGWFGTFDSKIFATTDRGETWQSYATPGVNTYMLSFRNEKEGVVRFNRSNISGTNMVSYTSDGGASWKTLAPITTTSNGWTLAEPEGRRIWIGNDFRVHVSSDNGDTWTEERMPNITTDDLYVADIYTDGDSTWIWAAGMEVFRNVVAFESQTVGVESVPSAEAFTVSAYPNPVMQGTAVALTVSGAERYTVAAYDMYGRQTNIPVQYTAGGTAHVSTAGLAAGMYTVAIRSGMQQQTVRIAVLK